MSARISFHSSSDGSGSGSSVESSTYVSTPYGSEETNALPWSGMSSAGVASGKRFSTEPDDDDGKSSVLRPLLSMTKKCTGPLANS